MMKKWINVFLMVIVVVSAISMMSMTAFAAEWDVIDETFSSVEITAEELTEGGETVTMPDEMTNAEVTEDVPASDNTDKSDDAFSVDGNGEVLDNVFDEKSGKEFYTITTANNNTYYLIIDHSSSTKNVYMLSMIDENDLKEFLSEEEPEIPEETKTPPSVNLDDETNENIQDKQNGKTDEQKKGGNLFGTVIIILVLGAIAGGGYFYFKIYKPKKEAKITDEDMEYVDDGVTVNEDDESEVGEVNANTPIDELAFDDEEQDTYDEE